MNAPALIATLLIPATLALRADDPSAAGAGSGASLRWVERSGRAVVEVVGLGDEELADLRRLGPADSRWPAVLSVRVTRPAAQPEAAPMSGRHEVDGRIVRFVPGYLLRDDLQYVARYRPLHMATGPNGKATIEAASPLKAATIGPASRVAAIYPTAGVLPENQLKLYLSFSAPMARGEAYRRVRLLDDRGRAVERPFLEIGEELWDPSGRRLTLLFDPGRIKRGLVPREEEGPILVEGRSYTFLVDPGWPDAGGRPLDEAYRKEFRVGPPDATQPDPSQWAIGPVRPGSREALVVGFPEPLDQAILGRAIVVRAGNATVAGVVEIGPGERSWRFTPEKPWRDEPVSLRIDAELEDLAGNSVARPFEVDLEGDRGARSGPIRVDVPVPRAR